MFFERLGINQKQLKSLIGAMIVKFSTAVITCWGNINLYFLSYFHYEGVHITPQTNSLILLFSVPPMAIAMYFSTVLCNRFGYQFVIRISCLLFFLSPMVNLIDFNIYVFTIFGVMIPGAMYSLISVPVLNCIWTQFPESKNKSTSILVIAFGVGGLVWNFLFMHMINPNNQDTIDEHQKINFFSQEVTKNVRYTTLLGFGITGFLAFVGSLLLERKNEQNQLKQQKQSIQSDKQQKNPQTQSTIKQQKPQPTTYVQALKDKRFIIIMLISFFTGLYQIYLMMNFKIIYMPIVNDDHFLSYSSMVCSVVAIFGAFIWGYLGDAKGVRFTILLLSFLDFCGKIYSDFALNKPMIIIMVVIIGLISKSMMTLAGPGLVQFFGINLGTQLLPLKGIAILLGYCFVPFFEILTSKFLTPHQYLICISFLSLFTLIAAIKLYFMKQETVKNQLKNGQQVLSNNFRIENGVSIDNSSTKNKNQGNNKIQQELQQIPIQIKSGINKWQIEPGDKKNINSQATAVNNSSQLNNSAVKKNKSILGEEYQEDIGGRSESVEVLKAKQATNVLTQDQDEHNDQN